MVLYLCSKSSSVVKIDNNPPFYLSNEPKMLEICQSNTPLIEIVKLNQPAVNFCFYPNQEFFLNPPKNVILTELLEGYHLFIKDDYSLLPFKVLAQKKTEQAVITVFCDRGYKISVETLLDYHLQDLDCQIDSAEIFDIDSNQNVFISLSGSEKILCAFNLKEKISLTFLKKVDAFDFSPILSTIEKFPTHLKHFKKCEWDFVDNCFKIKNFSLDTERRLEREKINDNLIPYLFLEGIFLGEDAQNYLCENLIPHKDKLISYLGEYVGVFPPPPNVCQDYVGLLYKKDENIYLTKYAKVDVQNKKVTNVKLIES